MEISIVIPAHNRHILLQETIASAKSALEGQQGEILVVDDGSTPILEQQLDKNSLENISIVYQANQGLIAAKNKGLSAAHGDYVLFLDSDDLIAKEKIGLQLSKQKEMLADVSYSNYGYFNNSTIRSSENSQPKKWKNPAEFYFYEQPSPHAPIYKTDYLKKALLENPLIPAERVYDSVGEVWMYYNLSIHPAKIVYIDQVLSYVRKHGEGQLTDSWERLSVAALHLAEAFLENCPKTKDTLPARLALCACAFHTWRGLPKQCPGDLEQRWLVLWNQCPDKKAVELKRLGGKNFQKLSKVFGPDFSARILKRLAKSTYQEISTISEAEVKQLLIRHK